MLVRKWFRRVRQGESIAGAGARGKRDLAWATATDMAIDAMFFRNRLETLSRADRLGGSEEKHAAIAQGEMKKRQDFVLRFRLQIDEEIAAARRDQCWRRARQPRYREP